MKKFIKRLSPLLAILVFLFFLYPDVFFLGRTLDTSQSIATVMPTGQYGYPGYGVILPTSLDPGAPAWQFTPLFELSLKEYREGRLPLWNPYSGLGAPLAANMQSSGFFLPQVFLAAIQGFDLHWDFYFLLRIFFAGLFTYLFCRKIGLSKASSLAGGFLFMGNGYFLFYGNMSHLNVEILLPFFLWCLESFWQKQKALRFFLLALASFLLVTGGFPKASFLAFLFGGLYLLFRFFQHRKGVAFLHSCAAIGFGILASAFLLLPFFDYAGNAVVPHIAEFSRGLLVWPLKSIVTLFFPHFFGSLPETWTTQNPVMPFVSLFTWPLLFLAFASKKYRSFAIFLAVISLFYLVKTFFFPIEALRIFGIPKYLFVEFAFATAILASFGFEAIVNIVRSEGKKKLLMRIGLPLLILGFLIETTSLYWFPRNLRYDPFTKPPFVEFLQEQKKTKPSFRIFSSDNYLLPNTAAVFQLHDIRMNDALYPKGYHELMRKLVPDFYDRFTGFEVDQKNFLIKNADLLNIRFVIVRPSSSFDIHGWEKVYEGEDAWIFENRSLRHNPTALASYQFDEEKHRRTFSLGVLLSLLSLALLVIYARLFLWERSRS